MLLRQFHRLTRTNPFTRPIRAKPPSHLRHIPIITNTKRSRLNSLRTNFTHNINSHTRITGQFLIPFTDANRRHLLEYTTKNSNISQRLFIMHLTITNRVLLSRLTSTTINQLRFTIRQRRHTMSFKVAQSRLHNTNTTLQRPARHPRTNQLNRKRRLLNPIRRIYNRMNFNITLHNINTRTIIHNLTILIKRRRSQHRPIVFNNMHVRHNNSITNISRTAKTAKLPNRRLRR